MGLEVPRLESKIRVQSRAGASGQGCLGAHTGSFGKDSLPRISTHTTSTPTSSTHTFPLQPPHLPLLATLFSASLIRVLVTPSLGLEASYISLLQPVNFKQKHRAPHPCIFLFVTSWPSRAMECSPGMSQGASCTQALAAPPSCGLLSWGLRAPLDPPFYILI